MNEDGVPMVSSLPLKPDGEILYDFSLPQRGLYWMHSHYGHQLHYGLAAPIVLQHPQAYLDSLGVQQDVIFFVADTFVRAECNFDYRLYPEICKGQRIPDDWANFDVTVNNRSVLDPAVVEVQPGSVIRLRTLHAGAMALWRISWPKELGQAEVVAVDGTDVERGVFVDSIRLANAQRMDVLIRIPENTKSNGWFPIVADRITGYYVQGTERTERTGMILKTPGTSQGPPIPSKFEGKLDGWMDLDLDRRLRARYPLSPKPVTRQLSLRLTGDFTDDYGPQFSLDDRRWYNFPGRGWVNKRDGSHSFGRIIQSNIPCNAECEGENWRHGSRCDPEWDSVPVDECPFFEPSDIPPRKNLYPLKVCDGDRVELTFVNEGAPRTGGDSHPIHMHGAHFQIVAVNGTRLENGPMRDTAYLPRWTNVTVAFDASNSGEWLIHCHIDFHLDQGMATTLEYTNDEKYCKSRPPPPTTTTTVTTTTTTTQEVTTTTTTTTKVVFDSTSESTVGLGNAPSSETVEEADGEDEKRKLMKDEPAAPVQGPPASSSSSSVSVIAVAAICVCVVGAILFSLLFKKKVQKEAEGALGSSESFVVKGSASFGVQQERNTVRRQTAQKV